MKYSLTLGLFLGLITKESLAVRIQNHHSHHKHHSHQGLAQYNGDSQAWVDDCYPGRDPYAQANGGAGINAAAAGVGVECQGFAQRGSKSLAQKSAHSLAQYNGDSQAWIDDCYPGRDPYAQANGGAGINAAAAGVGVECQGFA